MPDLDLENAEQIDYVFEWEGAITPVVRQETLDANPELAEQMNALSAAIDGLWNRDFFVAQHPSSFHTG